MDLSPKQWRRLLYLKQAFIDNKDRNLGDETIFVRYGEYEIGVCAEYSYADDFTYYGIKSDIYTDVYQHSPMSYPRERIYIKYNDDMTVKTCAVKTFLSGKETLQELSV